MKKVFAGILTGCLSLALTSGAMADTTEKVDVYEDNQLVKSVVFQVGSKQYFVNGQTPGTTMDVAPYVSSDGRTYVPVRYLGNALGVDNDHIAWDSSINQAALTLGDKTAKLTIGKKEIVATGETKKIDAAPEIKNSRTNLPARYVAEALGYQIAWDAKNKAVIAYPAGQEQPDISNVIDYISGEVQEQPQVPAEEPQVPEQQQEAIDVRQSTQTLGDKYQHPWFSPDDKVMYITADDLKKNNYKLLDTEVIYDIKIDDQYVYVKRSNPVGSSGFVFLIEGDKLRQRDPDRQSYPKGVPFWSKHAIIDEQRNKYTDWPTTDITKVDYIMIERTGAKLMVENPLKGGK